MAAVRKTTTVKSSGSRAELAKKAADKSSTTPAAKKVAAASAPAPVAKATKAAAKPAADTVRKVIAGKAAADKIAAKPTANTQESAMDFEAGDFVVYPVHGVGRIERVETLAIAGFSVKTYVITFDKERMTLKVPVSKARTAGLRKLSSKERIKSAMDILTGKAQVRRIMWSRRAQEYEAKINSGDPASIAEVVRDLHRAGDQPEQSYSERQIYQAAIERLAREVAAIEQIDEGQATTKLEAVLAAAA